MTSVIEDVVDSASIAAASTKRRSLWLLALRNSNVIVGGAILLVMVVIAITSNLSVGAMFLGGVLPGLIMAVGLTIGSWALFIWGLGLPYPLIVGY